MSNISIQCTQHTSNLGEAKGRSFQRKKKRNRNLYSDCATLICCKPPFFWLFYWNLYYLFTLLLKSLLSLDFSIGTSTFSTSLLKPLLSLYLSIEMSTFSWHFFKNLLSLDFSTFSLLFYWNFHFLFTSLLFYWNLYFLFTVLLKSLLSLDFHFLFTFRLKPPLSLYFSVGVSTHHARAPHLQQHYIAKNNHALLPPM